MLASPHALDVAASEGSFERGLVAPPRPEGVMTVDKTVGVFAERTDGLHSSHLLGGRTGLLRYLSLFVLGRAPNCFNNTLMISGQQ